MHNFLKTLACLCLMVTPAFAQDEVKSDPVPEITIDQAYAFATMPGGETGAAFMTIKNNGNAGDTLIKVKGDVAKITEIHENTIDPDNGTMMMRKIENIAVPSKEEAILEPKGKHIMLIKLKEPLTLESTFPLTLVFEKSGEKIIDVDVIQPGTKPETKEEGFPDSSFTQGNKDF